MSAFIDCMVCRARVVYRGERDDRAMTDAQLAAWFRRQGCSVGPTRCAEHAGAKGEKLVREAFASRASCTAKHDPEPWLTFAGIQMAQAVFNGGGSQSGRATLAPRAEFCQERSHYWLLDHLTLPADLLEVA